MQCFLMFAILLAGLVVNALADTPSPGETLYMQAQSLEKEMSCSQATEHYNRALSLLLQEGNTELAYDCDEAVRRLKIIGMTYPWTIEQLKDLIGEAYPQAPTIRSKAGQWARMCSKFFMTGRPTISMTPLQI